MTLALYRFLMQGNFRLRAGNLRRAYRRILMYLDQMRLQQGAVRSLNNNAGQPSLVQLQM